MMYNDNLKSIQIDEKEVECIDAYRGNSYKLINSLLEPGLANESEINSKLEFLPYDKESIKSALNVIINSYSGMFKNSLKRNNDGMSLYRGTTQEEISRVQNSKNIGRFMSTTRSKDMAEGFFSVNFENPAVIYVNVKGNIPYVEMSEVIEDYGDNWEKEVLLAPFTKVEELREVSKYNGKNYYNLSISKQELPEIEEKDRKTLYNEILDNSDVMGSKLKEYFNIQKDLENLEFQRENISRRMSGTGLSRDDRIDISERLQDIYKKYENLLESRKQYETEISDWKSKIVSYCKAECREKEISIEKDAKQEQEAYSKAEEEKRLYKANSILSDVKTDCISQIENAINLSRSMQTTLDSISYSQNQYEKLAEKYGLKYNKWCQTDKDKEAVNELNQKLYDVKTKIEEYTAAINDVDFEYSSKKIELDNLLSTTKEISFQLNQINSQNIDGAQKRELSGFKKSIEDKFIKLKADADMKKLQEDEQKIDSKNGFVKFVDRITGQKKVDEFRKNQIQKQKRAICITLNNMEKNNQVDESRAYSIHDILSKMDKYVIDNKENENLKSEIEEMMSLRNNVGKKFRVSEERVESLIEREKSAHLLPIQNTKMDKMTKAKLEADVWFAQSGYDVEEKRDIKNDLRVVEDNTPHSVARLSYYIGSVLNSRAKAQELDRDSNKNQR